MNPRLGIALAVLLVLAGCATAPVKPGPGPRPAGPPPSPGTASMPAPGLTRSWIAAESWEGFARTTLWPQEWALRHWHRWTFAGGNLQLTPAAPLAPPPAVRAVDQGGDPRFWAVDFPLPDEPSPERVITGVLTFPAAETGGVPPSVHALRAVLSSRKTGNGLVRVDSVGFDGVRFTVRYAEAALEAMAR